MRFPGKILYVEDNALLQRSMSRFFKRFFTEAADVVVVDNADDAILLLASQEYTLIVCDYDLANGTNGGQVLEWIKANDTDLLDHFVFLTGNKAVPETLHWNVVDKASSMDELRTVFLAFL